MAAAAPMASMILIPWIGTGPSQEVLIAALGVSGMLMLVPRLWPFRPANLANLLAIGAAAAIALLLAGTVSPVPGNLIAYGRRMMTSMGRSEVLFTGEGINSSIAITRWDDGAIQFHVSGKVEASTESYDMRLQRML